MLKFIPYDEIIKDEISIVSSNNYRNEWGLLKFHVFSLQTEPFVHIDGDVFIFNDLLSKYDNENKYDGIVQSIEIDKKYGIYDTFYNTNKTKLIEIGFIDELMINKSYDQYKAIIGYNNGIVGFKNLKFMGDYIESAYKLNNLINSGIFTGVKHQTMIFEQYLLYLMALRDEKNIYEVLPSSDIIEIGYNETGNKHGYTHLLSGNKYVGSFVQLVRNKILRDYPEYAENIHEFENSSCDANYVLLKHVKEDRLLQNVLAYDNSR